MQRRIEVGIRTHRRLLPLRLRAATITRDHLVRALREADDLGSRRPGRRPEHEFVQAALEELLTAYLLADIKSEVPNRAVLGVPRIDPIHRYRPVVRIGAVVVASVPTSDLALAKVGVYHSVEVLLANLAVDEHVAVDVAVPAPVFLDDDHVFPRLALKDVSEDVVDAATTLQSPTLDDVPEMISRTPPPAVSVL